MRTARATRAPSQSLETNPEAPAARAAAGDIRPAPEISSTRVDGEASRIASQTLGARLAGQEQVDERDMRLVARAPSASASAPVRAAMQRSTQGCSPSSTRKPQCTTSWSSTTRTRSLRSGASGRLGTALTPGPQPAGRRGARASCPRRARRTPPTPPCWSASNAARRSPMPGAARARRATPSLRTSSAERVVVAADRAPPPARGRRAWRCCAAPRPAPTGPAARRRRARVDLAGPDRPAPRRPGDCTEPRQLGGQRGAGLAGDAARAGRSSALRRSASASCISTRQRSRSSRSSALLGAQRQRHAEQALHHALVDLARQLQALAEPPRCAPAGGSRCAPWPPAPRSCPSVHSRWRSPSVSSKRPPPRSAQMTP